MPEFLLAGSSMLTVTLSIQDHLLITFGLRQLISAANDPADDDDRMVGANLVELASGKVLAQTQWRCTTAGSTCGVLGTDGFCCVSAIRYGAGANAERGQGDAFRELPLLHIDRNLVALQVSANERSVDSGDDQAHAGRRAGSSEQCDGGRSCSAGACSGAAHFYRLTSTGAGAEGLAVASAGAIGANDVVEIPMTTAGFLDVIEGGKTLAIQLRRACGQGGRVGGVGDFLLSATYLCRA